MKKIHYLILGIVLFSMALFASIQYLDKDTQSGWQSVDFADVNKDVKANKKMAWDAETESLKIEAKLEAHSANNAERPINLIMNETRAPNTNSANAKSMGDSNDSLSSNARNALAANAKATAFQNSGTGKKNAVNISGTGNTINFQQTQNVEKSRLTLVGENDQRYTAELTESGGFKSYGNLEDGHYRWEVFSSAKGANERAAQSGGIPSGTTGNQSDVTVERGRFEIRDGSVVQNVMPEEDLEALRQRDGEE